MVASFGNRRSMWCLNGGGIVELSCCPFFKPGGADSLRFVFRMNRATCGGRIWDSTHPLYFLSITSFAVFPAVR